MADMTPEEEAELLAAAMADIPAGDEPASIRMHLVTGHRCHVRDARDQRCAVVGEHQTVTNSNGRAAIVHETKYSMWSVPIMVGLTAPLEDR